MACAIEILVMSFIQETHIEVSNPVIRGQPHPVIPSNLIYIFLGDLRPVTFGHTDVVRSVTCGWERLNFLG